jgi:hypothetical protein
MLNNFCDLDGFWFIDGKPTRNPYDSAAVDRRAQARLKCDQLASG